MMSSLNSGYPMRVTDSMGQPKDEDEGLMEEDELLFDEDDDDEEFRIWDPLPEHTQYVQTLSEIHRMAHEGEIELNPPYQRDVVWSPGKQSQLIESLFRNFTIPQVVFAVQVDEDGDEIRMCVDGKQRLSSIVNFFDGLLPYKDPRTKQNFYWTTSEAQKGVRLLLPDKVKAKFAQKTISVSEYKNITKLQEREVFQRVQLGVPLKTAEKLKAIESPWATWISKLEQMHMQIDGGLSTKIDFDSKNARDFQNIVCMIFCCYELPNESSPTATKVEKFLSSQTEPEKIFKEDMDAVLLAMYAIAADPECNEGFVKIAKKVSPVEFIFIGVLLYVLRHLNENKDNSADRSGRKKQGRAIYSLRHAIREQFKDMRNNTSICKVFWQLINQLEARPTAWLSNAPKSPVAAKRKRTLNEDDDTDDYAPAGGKKSKSKGKVKR